MLAHLFVQDELMTQWWLPTIRIINLRIEIMKKKNTEESAEVCEFKYLASAESRNPFGGEIAHALTAGCADAAVGVKVETSYGINANSGNMIPCDEEVGQTQTVCHQNGVAQATPTSYIVRRLTPTECERLMGYPDNYTIPTGLQITDALVEEFQDIFANFATITEPNKPVKRKSAKQIRAWLEKIANPATCPDAPRYKVCGNGWAINCAQFVVQGIDKFLSAKGGDE